MGTKTADLTVDGFLDLLDTPDSNVSRRVGRYAFDGRFFDWSEVREDGGVMMLVGDGTDERSDEPVHLLLTRADLLDLFGFLGRWCATAGEVTVGIPVDRQRLLAGLLDGLGLVTAAAADTAPRPWFMTADEAIIGFCRSRFFGWHLPHPRGSRVQFNVESYGDRVTVDGHVYDLVLLFVNIGVWLIENGGLDSRTP